MKKFTIAIISMTALFFTSCGGGGTTNKAISDAEQEVPITSESLLGELPSWEKQYKAAKTALKSEFMAKLKGIKSEDMEKAGKEADKLKEEMKAAEEELTAHYEPKIKAAGDKLVGKEIPCTFDTALFSAAKVVIDAVSTKDGRLSATATVTLAGSLGRTPYVMFEYRDASGKKLSTGAEYLKKGVDCSVGSQIQLKLDPNASKVEGLASVHFMQ